MMRVNQQNQSPLDNEPFFLFIVTQVENGLTNKGIAKWISKGFSTKGQIFILPTTDDSIRRFRKRHKLSIPTRNESAFKIEGNEAELTTPPRERNTNRPYPHMDNPDKMLEERGLSPEDWIIQGATVNEWDGPKAGGSVVTYHQAKLQLKRKHPELQILPARADGPLFQVPSLIPSQNNIGPQLIVVTGDQQAPFHDEKLHYLFCGWLEKNKPDRGVALGDKIDLPNISKHKLDPENTALVNECIQSGYDLWRDYRVSSPNTFWDFMPGNHDLRIRDLLLDKPSVIPLYGIKRPDTLEEEGERVLSLSHLLRLDELGVNYVDPHGPYEMAQINLSDKLAVRHGWIVRQGSGSSALATLDHLGYSVITGHTHRQSMVYQTKHEIDGSPRQIVGVEAGCMCRVNQSLIDGRKWPNFVTSPDWQNGFVTVRLWPDGGFKVDLATYVNGVLYYGEERYE
jgi:hypothetical protein